MSEDEIVQKRIKELEDQIHVMRMDKLLTIDHIKQEITGVAIQMDKCRERIKKYEEAMEKCEPKEIRRYKELIGCVIADREILGKKKAMFDSLRYLIKNIQKEEERLTFLKLKAT